MKPDKKCPTCESNDYRFRARKTVEFGQSIETKYRCSACEHQWKVRVPLSEMPAMATAQELPPLWEVDGAENL